MGELYEPYPRLPKNIRQIGERDQVLKLYVEDYVNTYLKRLRPKGGADLRVGLLLGNVEMRGEVPYVFVDGALEMEGVTREGETVAFTEDAFKKAYQELEQMFPKRSVQGWFLCGAPDCGLNPLNYWKQHGQYFTGKHQLMYLSCGPEGEEAIYITSPDGFYKLKGYSIFYERNQMMQDYMVLRRETQRVETGVDDQVIRDFKKRMDQRRTEAVQEKGTVHLLTGLCGVLTITVLAGGVAMFGNFQKMRRMESVIASVLPGGTVREEAVKASGSPVMLETMSPVKPEEGNRQESGQTESGLAENGRTESGLAESRQPEDKTTESGLGEGGPGESGRTEAGQESGKPEAEKGPTENGQPENEAASQAVLSQADLPLEDYRVYQVAQGETLYGICFKEYGNISCLPEILAANGLENEDSIYAGQELLIP